MKECDDLIRRKLIKLHEQWDSSENLIGEYKDAVGAGYHSRLTGIVHETNKSAEYATAILYLEDSEHYDRADKVFMKLAQIQDVDKDSDTFGLWSYYMEEPLSEMRAPDYNFSDFIGKHFIYALSQRSHCLRPETVEVMKTALKNAISCSIKRNVSCDYSNISMMSCMTIISAGELLKDQNFFETGKRRLKKAYEYNKFCGAFSEYNSSTYTPLLIVELTRMLMYFKDKECRDMAFELHDMAWEDLSRYYNINSDEIAPPQKRAYRDIDDGQLSAFVYIATDGKYGNFDRAGNLPLSYLTLPIRCPDKFIGNFLMGKRFFEQTYYRKNNIRSNDEDTVIVRNVDSPDLKAYTYIDGSCAMGTFDKSDLWNQRRTCSVVWKYGEKVRSFRMRGIIGDYDYCSAVVAADMYENIIVGAFGYVTDHGSFHYILDKDKSSVIKTNRLAFVFELSGDCNDVKIERFGDDFVISDPSLKINLRIYDWVFDGNKGEIKQKDNRIELVAYDGEEREFDISTLKESFGAFAMSINTDLPKGGVVSDWDTVRIKAYGGKLLTAAVSAKPVTYNEFMQI